MLKGIDISSYQAPAKIDYDKIAGQVDFVILRAGFTGYGTVFSLNKDSAFERHYAEFLKRGVPMGAYWYSCANTEAEGIREAENLLALVKGKRFEWPLWFDTEDNHHQRPTSKAKLTDTAIAFLKTIEAAGYFAGYYCSTYWERDELDMNRLKPYANWQADYRKTIYLTKEDCGIWQYSSSGKLDGYSGNLDMNSAFINYGALVKSVGLNHLKESEIKTYDVIAGDSLESIAKKLDVSVDHISSLNEFVQVGQKLKY